MGKREKKKKKLCLRIYKNTLKNIIYIYIYIERERERERERIFNCEKLRFLIVLEIIREEEVT